MFCARIESCVRLTQLRRFFMYYLRRKYDGHVRAWMVEVEGYRLQQANKKPNVKWTFSYAWKLAHIDISKEWLVGNTAQWTHSSFFLFWIGVCELLVSLLVCI